MSHVQLPIYILCITDLEPYGTQAARTDAEIDRLTGPRTICSTDLEPFVAQAASRTEMDAEIDRLMPIVIATWKSRPSLVLEKKKLTIKDD